MRVLRGSRATCLATAFAAGLLVAGPVRAAVLGCSSGALTAAGKAWILAQPSFPRGTQLVASYAVARAAPQLLYATNGTLLLRSTTSGCTWDVVYDVEATAGQIPLPLAPAEPQRRVVAVGTSASPHHVYVAIEERTAALIRPRMLRSVDRGVTWAEATGLPAVGAIRELAVSPALADTAYLTVATELPVAGARVEVYRTTDGLAWSRRTPDGQAVAVDRLAVDPLTPERLYGIGPAGALRSTDGGGSFEPMGPPSADVSDVAVALRAGGRRVVIGRRRAAVVEVSEDGGATFRARPVPVPAHAVAASDVSDGLVVSGSTRAFALGQAGVTDVTPTTEMPTRLVLVRSSGDRSQMFGLTPSGIVRLTVDYTYQPPPSMPPIDLGPIPDVVEPGSAVLLPARRSVALQVGQSTRVPYLLDVPRSPTPLDVYFVIDTTGSMGGIIAGLRQGIGRIVEDLADSGIDARFGLAEFKDYPISPYGGDADVAYRRLRAVGRPDDELRDAIERLQASGGGDGPESALTALYQSVTGAGETVDDREHVASGQDARFRPSAVPVLVTATDVEFHQRGQGYPGPTFAETTRALRDAKAYHVGLSAGGGRPDLERASRETSTFAPAGGVDCDGDGKADVREGEPMVCDVGPGTPIDNVVKPGAGRIELAEAIVSLLRAVRDEATVGLTAHSGGVARVLAPSNFRDVDLKADHRFGFEVELACGSDTGGRTFPVELVATAGRRELAAARATLTCLASAAPPPPVVDHRVRALPAGVVVPPPPPPPQPVPQTNPNLNPNPNPHANSQPQSNVNPQTGLAAQEQEQPQLAYVFVEDAPANVDLAMSARSRDEGVALATLAAAMATAVACGAALHRRSALAIQLAPCWRDRGR